MDQGEELGEWVWSDLYVTDVRLFPGESLGMVHARGKRLFARILRDGSDVGEVAITSLLAHASA